MSDDEIFGDYEDMETDKKQSDKGAKSKSQRNGTGMLTLCCIEW